MTFLSFTSLAELVAFVTSLVAGISLIMGVNAVNSAPSFMLNYFQYVAHDPDAVAKHPSFWKNVLTYYTVVTQVTQMLLEPTNLTPFFQRFSIIFRMEVATLFMLAELLVVVIMPHTTHDETGAMAGMMVAAFIGGLGRAYFENSSYALFGPFPPRFMAGVMCGVPLSGSIVSLLQIILLAAMDNTYDSILTQSIIYFSISLGLIFLSGACLLLLVFNSYARRYVMELHMERGLRGTIYHIENGIAAANAPAAEGEGVGASESNEPAMSELQAQSAGGVKHLDGNQCDEADGEELQAVGSDGLVQTGVLEDVALWPIFKKIWPMMMSCCLTFLVTYLIYPGVLIAVNSSDNWYTTLILAVYHFTDLIGRLMTLWKRLWPPRKAVVIICIASLVFLPLLLLCAKHIIPSEAAAYVFTALMGLTTGFFGTVTMVYTPETPGLATNAQRSCAGQLAGVSLLIGAAVGSLVQLPMVLGL